MPFLSLPLSTLYAAVSSSTNMNIISVWAIQFRSVHSESVSVYILELRMVCALFLRLFNCCFISHPIQTTHIRAHLEADAVLQTTPQSRKEMGRKTFPFAFSFLLRFSYLSFLFHFFCSTIACTHTRVRATLTISLRIESVLVCWRARVCVHVSFSFRCPSTRHQPLPLAHRLDGITTSQSTISYMQLSKPNGSIFSARSYCHSLVNIPFAATKLFPLFGACVCVWCDVVCCERAWFTINPNCWLCKYFHTFWFWIEFCRAGSQFEHNPIRCHRTPFDFWWLANSI